MTRTAAPADDNAPLEAINPPAAGVDATPRHVEETFVGSHSEQLKASDPAAWEAIYGTGEVKAEIDPDLAFEGEEEEEEEDDQQPVATKPAKAAKPAKTADEPMIPLSRLNEVLGKFDALQARMEAAEAGRAAATTAEPAAKAEPPPPAFDLAAKIRERNAAQWDGNEDRAIEIELEIEAYRQEQATKNAVAAIKGETAAETANNEFISVATQLTEAYPELDATHANANPDAINAVKLERDVQIKAGQPPAVALKRAVNIVAAEHGLTRVEPKTTTRQPANTGGRPGDITPRMVDAAKMAAKVANTPPNNVGGAGYGEVKDDARPIGRDEWSSLTTAEKNKRLGIG